MAVKPRFDGEWVRLDEVACINPKQPRGLGATDKVSFLPLAEVNMDGTTNLGIESVRSEVSKGHPWFVDGDLLLAKITPSFENGKIALASTAYGEGYTSTEFHIIRPDDKLVVREFLLAYLRSRNVERYCAARMKGSAGQKRVPVEVLKRLQVPAIPLEAQRGIASQFGSISRQLNDCKTQLEMLDDLVKSRFVEMFGDQKLNNKQLPQKRLREVSLVGSSRRVFKEELVERGIPFLRGTEVGSYGLGKRVEPSLFITPTHYESLISRAGKPEIGDLLLPSICPDGQIWEVDTEEPFYFKDGRVLWVRPDRGCLNSTFLRYALKNRFESDFQGLASGTTFAELKIVILKEMSITLPPLSLQQEFASFSASVDKSRFIVQQKIEKLQMLYDSLAQEYFS